MLSGVKPQKSFMIKQMDNKKFNIRITWSLNLENFRENKKYY